MTEEKKFRLEFKHFALMALVAVISCFITAGATLSRYVTQTNAFFDDGKEVHEYLDFTVNSVFEVRNQMELFAAINQGYSFIRLSQEIENPLIVTQKAETLDSDLILDLNGIEIQRNGYEPILNIKSGVRLTVVDTSGTGQGGLYNPVGSVFNITGGVLTVATGHFESGPRYSEYYSYNNQVVDHTGSNKYTTVLDDEELVHFHVRGSDGGYGNSISRTAPIIRSYPTKVNGVDYVHGNLYFDEEYESDSMTIPADTYCYYRTSEDAIDGQQEMIQLACDWYYMYWVDLNYNYAFAELPEGADVDQYIEIAIYGYENVIENASKEDKQSEYFAAIQMSSGTLDVQDGQFFSYFGVPTTACVNATGGEIDITKGEFSSRIPNATSSVVNATDPKINEKHDDTDAFGTDYFNVFNWNSDAEGSRAKVGQAYCILNSGNAAVSIGEGSFRSTNNNIISMQAGDLTVKTGDFAKRSTIDAASNTDSKSAMIYMGDGTLRIDDATASVFGRNNVGIMMHNGTLTFNNATSFVVDGDGAIGIRMDNGKLTVGEANYTIKGSNTYGIYSTVSGQDDFVLTDVSFTLDGGDNQTGIYAENGRVQVIASASTPEISTTGDGSKGIHVTNGGSVLSTGYSYTLGGGSSHGIYSTNGQVTVSDGDITMTGDSDCEGIFSETGAISFTNGDITIAGANSNGLHSQNATITVTNGNMSLAGVASKGIHSTGGNITMTGGGITLDSNQTCYGIYAASDAAMAISLENTNVSVGYNSTAGRSGTVDATVGVFMETSVATNKITLTNASVSSYEVGILLRGGSLDVKGDGATTATIATKKASSIVVLGGSLTFDESCRYSITSSTTRNNRTTNEYTIDLPTTKGADKTYANTDGVYVSGGNFTSNGTTNITHTGLYNDTNTWNVYTDIQMTSFAVRVLGGKVKIDKGSISSSVGGGLCCNGGNVELGNQNSLSTDISITTSGMDTIGELWNPIGVWGDESWQRYKTTNGGNAVEINGGSLKVYNGTYQAAFGDGIVLKVPGGSTATVDIHGGTYYGGMVGNSRSGPGASYGVKVYGSSTINIYDGRFDGKGGGACVAGVYDYEYTNGQRIIHYDENNPANVYIYKGTFGSSVARDGFMIYDYANIIFGAGDQEYLQKYIDQGINPIDLIHIESELAPFSVNWITYEAPTQPKSSNIEVYYGNYDNDCDYAGWNKSGNASQVQFYNFRFTTHATYNSDGGYQESVRNMNNQALVYYDDP